MNTSAQSEGHTVSHHESRRKGVFRIGNGAEMSYLRPSEQVMDVNHTLVDEAHRGMGLAHKLYQAMTEFARENQRKVIPSCPFVEAMFEQNPQDSELLETGSS
jgi:predicted GNAT family acetyltransferase